MLAKVAAAMGQEETDELVSMVRGCDIPICEYCYLPGLEDGMRLKETLERMQKT